MKRLVILSLIAILPVLSACNTIKGVGRDIESVGEALDKSTR
ncbi:MAG: entericidin A/B family lipoprotein [Asticcacaulis sp.]|jgi:predicted small secreted protein|uniref:Entericidin EcnAB n=1 Tax=Asticcacaulis excentricus (strain ATCC 15261 / DSM 4724 / KCTC 12464 / NCIMB 9791 / VKM B-1370 / CB 48) TaxID=573065 RepID=E8RTL3_ASTEC|nr:MULTISPECIES: entericidin A/B family lipoprotein [Asticcacaulis]ADU14834.1 Entericidin EcnAB [Asticcacaulis excentricus CB 48]MCA1934198.1 entericidin A/B family lipoprotein [Asticcacaulis sp.]